MDKTAAQIEFWENRVYPIYSRANKFFRAWIDHTIPKVRTNKIPHYPLSDITFSILDKKGNVNASRFAIGVLKPDIEDYELFNEVAAILTKRKLFVEPDSKIIGLGIGEDLQAGEDKFYVAFHNPWTKKVKIVGWTFKHGNLIEVKRYSPVKRGFLGVGERGRRLQLDYELAGSEALKVIAGLKISPAAKALATKVIMSGLFSLDTVSYSKKRGTALYFD